MSDSAEITQGESLWETLDVLRDSGQHGAKVCLGMANFLSERAAIETSYGNVRKPSTTPNRVESPLPSLRTIQQYQVVNLVWRRCASLSCLCETDLRLYLSHCRTLASREKHNALIAYSSLIAKMKPGHRVCVRPNSEREHTPLVFWIFAPNKIKFLSCDSSNRGQHGEGLTIIRQIRLRCCHHPLRTL